MNYVTRKGNIILRHHRDDHCCIYGSFSCISLLSCVIIIQIVVQRNVGMYFSFLSNLGEFD